MNPLLSERCFLFKVINLLIKNARCVRSLQFHPRIWIWADPWKSHAWIFDEEKTESTTSKVPRTDSWGLKTSLGTADKPRSLHLSPDLDCPQTSSRLPVCLLTSLSTLPSTQTLPAILTSHKQESLLSIPDVLRSRGKGKDQRRQESHSEFTGRCGLNGQWGRAGGNSYCDVRKDDRLKSVWCFKGTTDPPACSWLAHSFRGT